ncbi:MAG: response regulator transcription factor [Dehalococcoidia bacterium]|nr:response regulator transcription factor [Dehalococcoidia bacterium]
MRAAPLRIAVLGGPPASGTGRRAGLRVLLVDAGFDVVLADDATAEPEAEAADAAALDRALGRVDVDVAVAELGGAADVEAVATFAARTAAPLVLLGGRGDELARALAGVPHARLPRDATADELAAAVRAVAAGLIVAHPAALRGVPSAGVGGAHDDERWGDDPGLTPRELEVLRELARGLPNKAVARELGISEHTVKYHTGAIFAKLGARSRTEAVTLAARRGLLAL